MVPTSKPGYLNSRKYPQRTFTPLGPCRVKSLTSTSRREVIPINPLWSNTVGNLTTTARRDPTRWESRTGTRGSRTRDLEDPRRMDPRLATVRSLSSNSNMARSVPVTPTTRTGTEMEGTEEEKDSSQIKGCTVPKQSKAKKRGSRRTNYLDNRYPFPDINSKLHIFII